MKTDFPWFPLFPQDYLGDTVGLSCCEHGCYMLLLMHSWRRGPLTHDLDRLQRMAGDPPMETLRFILETYWEKVDVGWTNHKLEQIRKKQEKAKDINKDRAKKAARARWDARSNAQAMLEQCSDDAREMLPQNSELRTHNSGISPADAGGGTSSKIPPCPHQKIRDLFAEVLPECRQSRVWDETDQSHLRARWAEDPDRQDLAWWRGFFEWIRKSDFLMGKTGNERSRPPFRLTLRWLVKRENFKKVLDEGKYHG
jgi:uncharacterized protein YdaU (DUF1376 family)